MVSSLLRTQARVKALGSSNLLPSAMESYPGRRPGLVGNECVPQGMVFDPPALRQAPLDELVTVATLSRWNLRVRVP